MDGFSDGGEPPYWKKAVFSMMKKFIPRGVARLFTMEGRKKKEGLPSKRVFEKLQLSKCVIGKYFLILAKQGSEQAHSRPSPKVSR